MVEYSATSPLDQRPCTMPSMATGIPSLPRSAPPWRIALVITELEPGGAERCLVELATRLDPTRLQVAVFALAGRPPAPRHGLVERLERAGLPVHFLGCNRWWQVFTAVRSLSKHLREHRTQLVQTFLFHANLVGLWAAQQAGVPRRVTSVRVADPRPWRMWMERWGTARADRITCVSQSVANHCRRYGFPQEKLVVIPNGVDLARLSRLEPADLCTLGVSPGHKTLLFAGRLDRQKGIDAFLPIATKILEEFPDWEWVVVGDGPLRPWLIQQASASPAGRRIHFVGWQPDVGPIMAASDVLVLPSRWEGMPNVVLEAMACGKPVLATRTEGVTELLGEAAEEQTVDLEDWKGLADRLRLWLADPACRQRLGAANLRRAEHFSVEKMIHTYAELYEGLLTGAG
jgi:glycosyltransferase involved in cell wall biosynthesis